MLPTLAGTVTNGFGVIGPWAAGYHTGRDYRARWSPIRATRGGEVVVSGWNWFFGPEYGLMVVIQTGGIRHLYAHLSKTAVKVGQSVKTGDHIGVSGESGRTFGPHLHYEERVWNYGYYDHRRPQFDLAAAPIPTMDVSKLAYAARNETKYDLVSLFKIELRDTLRDNNRRVLDMDTGDTFGDAARENTRRLQRLWYPDGDWRPGIPAERLVRRLGNRRAKWKTVD